MTPEARVWIEQHPWPGNVRELSNVIQKALIFNRGAPLSSEDLTQIAIPTTTDEPKDFEAIETSIRKWVRTLLARKEQDGAFDFCLDRLAKVIISEALTLSGGNRSRAAKLLGLSRPNLHSKINKYDLVFETRVKKE